MTWEAAAFRPDKAAATGAFFGDDQWGLQGRITALPLYEDEGRHLLHVGLSGGWRTGGNTTAGGIQGRDLSCRRGPNCATTTPPAPLAVWPTATG